MCFHNSASLSKKLVRFNITAIVFLAFVWQIFAPVAILAQEGSRELQLEKSTTAKENRTALVIGNSAYKTSPLNNPANDAMDMAEALKSLDFEVISGINQSRADMIRLVWQFGERLKTRGGVGLFYYAGHGVQVEGRNYLIPVDAEIRLEKEVELEAMDVSRVLNEIDKADNGLNIVILDACRNNPFSRSWRSTNDGLAQINAPNGTLIAYSTAPGKISSDGAGRNAPYTAALLKTLRIPDLSLFDVFMQVRAEVQKATNRQQTPWEASSVVGRFYFIKTEVNINAGKTQTSLPAEAESIIVAKDKVAQEREAWDSIKNSTNVTRFRLFLAEFPNGANSERAKIRLEDLVWVSVRDSNDKTKVQAFLDEFPNGANAWAARFKLRDPQLCRPATADEQEQGLLTRCPRP